MSSIVSQISAADRARRRYRLTENIFDLSVELRDLADEIETRQARIAEVLAMLRANRRELAILEADWLVER